MPNTTAPSFSKIILAPFHRADSTRRPTSSNPEDDWYIPYNGPYEAPPPEAQAQKLKARDSWGDPIDEDDGLLAEDDTVLADRELHIRYGGQNVRTSARPTVDDEPRRTSRPRDRTFSAGSGRTASSGGAVDPLRSRGSVTTQRRSTVSSGVPPPVPAYVPHDGGVGESPVPNQHREKQNTRISLASIFGFSGTGAAARKSSLPLPVSSSTEQAHRSHSRSNSASGSPLKRLKSISTTTTTEESRLSPTSDRSREISQPLSFQDVDATRRKHRPPYPSPLTRPPNSADLNGFQRSAWTKTSALKSPSSTPNLREAGRAPPHKGRHVHATAGPSEPKPHPHFDAKPPPFVPPKGKEKWLSAETWCDALLFPRPRLKLKAPKSFSRSSSSQRTPVSPNDTESFDALGSSSALISHRQGQGQATPISPSRRIVSPPDTPLAGDFTPALIGGDPSKWSQDYEIWKASKQHAAQDTVPSRVLLHSKSAVDLLHRKDSKGRLRTVTSGEPGARKDVVLLRRGDPEDKGARPKSFAADDLALPSPVPSLAHVLADAQNLSAERAAWARQAATSFGNKHTRTLSRSRSKSLTARGRSQIHGTGRGLVKNQSSIEYLAAQACLGSQNAALLLTPTLPPAVPKVSAQPSGTVTTSGAGPGTGKLTYNHSHTHTNSHSQHGTHSRTHSRNDSWSQRVVRVCGGTSVEESYDDHDRDRDGRTTASPSLLSEEEKELGYGHVTYGYARAGREAHYVSFDSVGGSGANPWDRDRVKRIDFAVPPPPTVSPPAPPGVYVTPPTATKRISPQKPQPQTQHNVPARKTSPTPSDTYSRVGIALSTPPPPSILGGSSEGSGGHGVNGGAMDGDGDSLNIYVPNHPYAQGGLSFSQVTSSASPPPAKRGADFAGPHPSIVNTARGPPIRDMVARHKQQASAGAGAKATPPPLHIHPYAAYEGDEEGDDVTGERKRERDSYLDRNPLYAQFRSGDRAPGPSKMWAQLSPGSGGVVREVIEEDLKYSPFASPEETSRLGGAGSGTTTEPNSRPETVMLINDTVGVGEALVRAESRWKERKQQQQQQHHHHPLPKIPQPASPFVLPDIRTSPRIESTLPASLGLRPLPVPHQPSNPSDSNGSKSHSTSDRSLLVLPEHDRERTASHSPGITSVTTSSPPHSPRRLGSPNDMEPFHNLFYRHQPTPTEDDDDDDDDDEHHGLPITRHISATTASSSGVGRVDSPSVDVDLSIPGTPSGLGMGLSGASGSGPSSAYAPSSTFSWNLSMSMQSRRTGSGLTSLARQLSEELEVIAMEREQLQIQSRLRDRGHMDRRTNSSFGSFGSIAGASVAGAGGKNLVFDETIPRSLSPVEGTQEGEVLDDDEDVLGVHGMSMGKIQAFRPSGVLPEDVRSSVSSSMIVQEDEDDEDDSNVMLRMAKSQPLSTPPILSSGASHTSHMGEMAFMHSHPSRAPPAPAAKDIEDELASRSPPEERERITSTLSLQAPLTDMTRSSYMTTSTMSRMSGLSDFPIPPKDYFGTSAGGQTHGHSQDRSHYQSYGVGAPASPTALTILSGAKPPSAQKQKHMSLLSSYFDAALVESEARGLTPGRAAPPLPTTSGATLGGKERTASPVVFGGDQDAEDLVKTLSSHGHGSG